MQRKGRGLLGGWINCSIVFLVCTCLSLLTCAFLGAKHKTRLCEVWLPKGYELVSADQFGVVNSSSEQLPLKAYQKLLGTESGQKMIILDDTNPMKQYAGIVYFVHKDGVMYSSRIPISYSVIMQFVEPHLNRDQSTITFKVEQNWSTTILMSMIMGFAGLLFVGVTGTVIYDSWKEHKQNTGSVFGTN